MTSFNVAGLLHEPPGSTRDIRLRDHYVTLGPDVELAGPLDADLRLQRTNRGIFLRGELRAPLRRVCGRCTEPYVDDVRVPVEEEFLPTLDPVTGVPVRTDGADDATTQWIDEHHEIELDGVFHDELALTEPMLPLCRPDCPGLCVECGERLDRGDHAHGGPEIDPRLAGLAALLDRGDAGEDDPERN
ncbi:MAG TPA: DUF177 domain-containing protein [Candidatus Limnocylindria bacterium]|jgi:uncharacterized protein|nr:DUF177 domain-containing protein [Candidatus Limnocylindria bacterium]